MPLKHAFVSAVADGADATLVRPSDWNADHVGFPSLSTYEANLGDVLGGSRMTGTFDITGLSGLTAGKPVLVFQIPGPYTDKGTREDEAEVGLVSATGYVYDATTIRVFWRSDEPIAGSIVFAYAVTA